MSRSSSAAFEDAFCATMLNTDLAAVVIHEGFAVPLAPRCAGAAHACVDPLADPEAPDASALRLAQVLKRVRPELDLYLLSKRDVEEIAGNPEAERSAASSTRSRNCSSCTSAMLEGVQDALRDAVLRQPEEIRAAADRHLPRPADRARQVGLQVRLDPRHGRVLRRRTCSWPKAAPPPAASTACSSRPATSRRRRRWPRAPSAPTTCSSSPTARRRRNKMAVQALLAPGDIVIVDRNCHKSHHYGMVLAGAQPLYVEAFPMTEYSMYGAVPLRTIKQALLDLQAEGRLDRVKMVDLTNCTFDGHIYNTRRVMEECLAIKPDLIFLWDEAWFGFARFSPFLRPRTAMGAADDIEAWLRDPASRSRPTKSSSAELGDNPSDEALLEHAPDSRPAQGPAARLPDQLHAQVDVGAAPGLDAAGQGRRLPHGRSAVP